MEKYMAHLSGEDAPNELYCINDFMLLAIAVYFDGFKVVYHSQIVWCSNFQMYNRTFINTMQFIGRGYGHFDSM